MRNAQTAENRSPLKAKTAKAETAGILSARRNSGRIPVHPTKRPHRPQTQPQRPPKTLRDGQKAAHPAYFGGRRYHTCLHGTETGATAPKIIPGYPGSHKTNASSGAGLAALRASWPEKPLPQGAPIFPTADFKTSDKRENTADASRPASKKNNINTEQPAHAGHHETIRIIPPGNT